MSLLRVQSRSLKGFYHHILNQRIQPSNQAENIHDSTLNSKLIQFLINEAYFDFQEDKGGGEDLAIEPISDLCFICCFHETMHQKT